MTIQTIPQTRLPDWQCTTGSFGTSLAVSLGAFATLDAANEAWYYAGPCPASGELTKIYFRLGTVSVTSGPLNFDVRLESLNSSGRPDGTLWETGSNVACSIADTDDNTWKTNTLGTSGTVVKGNRIAIVVKAPASGTFSVQFMGLNGLFGTTGVFPCAMSDTSGTPDGTYESVLRSALCLAVEIDGEIYNLQCCHGEDGSATWTYNSSSSPDEYAARIKYLCTCRVIGARILTRNTPTTADITVSIWPDSASSQTDANALAQAIFNGDTASSTSDDGFVTVLFASPIVLSANTIYWCGVRSDSAGDITVIGLTVTSSPALIKAMPTGQEFYLGTRTWSAGSASAFTPVATSIPIIELLVDGLDDGAGGAGGLLTHPGMTGGIRG